MNNIDNIDKMFRQYTKLSLWVNAGITLLGLLITQAVVRMAFINILAICSVYTLPISYLYGISWKYIARHSPNVLAKFYIGAPAIRMVLAFCLILLYGLATKKRDTILSFTVVFIVYYIAMLFFDAFYFSHIEKNRNIKNR